MAAISEPLTLVFGALSVGLVPAIGGSVGHFRWHDIDLMRPLSAADLKAGNVLGTACFPMVPYANRISGNAFDFEGHSFRFTANNPPEKLNVHGTGWHRPWTVERASENDALLTLTVTGPAEPYAYRTSQHFALADNRLRVTMSVSNLGPTRAPFGFGLHPWLPRDPDVTLQFWADRFYLEEPEGISGNPVTLPPELDFSAARPLPDGWRNNDYGGWNGTAQIHYPSRRAGLRIAADPVFRHLMVYADPRKPYFW